MIHFSKSPNLYVTVITTSIKNIININNDKRTIHLTFGSVIWNIKKMKNK
jgi:hypothetical protein